MKKYISGILIAAALFESMAYAAEITAKRDIETGSYNFSVTADKDEAVTVDIYAPGKTFSDMLAAQDALDVLKYHNEVYGGEDGTCTFRARFAGESGVYNAFVTVGGEKKELKLEFVNSAANKTALEGLNAASDIEAYIEANRADLGFFMELYDEVGKASVCSMLKAYIPFDTTKPQAAIDKFNAAVLAQAISENKITGISDYKDSVSVLNDGSKTAKWYEKADAAGVDSRINGKKLSSVAEFEKAVGEAVVLQVIQKPNGYENVKNIISDFAAEIGISSPTDSASVYQQLAGNSFASYAALKAAYESAIIKKPTDGSGSGGSRDNTGGGGGNTSKTPNKVTTGNGLAFQPEVNPQPLEKEYFGDMENAAWAKKAVNYLAEKKIVSGKSENEFCPSDNVGREEFVTMIVKAFGFEKFTDESRFEDVPNDKWFYEYVTAASQNGIVSGLTEESFGAGEKITRQDMAAILYRVAEKKKFDLKATADEATFADAADIAEYAKEAVSYMQTRGIVSGMEDGSFKPNEYASRAQAAQMIYKLLSSQEGK